MALVLFPNFTSAASRSDTLDAIHRVENPLNSSRPGKFGELGAYQFRRSTWHMHTSQPFERALDRATSERIAVLHYEWLSRGLVRRGLPVTPYNVALAWNGGLTSTIRGRSSRAAHDYAQRVTNLVGDLSTNRLAVVP